MSLPPLPVAARVALVVAALACAAWLRDGRYAIGIDFAGGAHVLVRPRADPQQTLLHVLRARPDARVKREGDLLSIMMDGGDIDDAHALVHELVSEADVDTIAVIRSTWPGWLGRPLATIVAFAAALCWLGLLARPRWWPLGIVGTLALAWTLAIVDQVALGMTLSLPVHCSGILLGLAVAYAARPGTGDPLARLRRGWPVAIALLLLLVASAVVASSFQQAPRDDVARIAYFSIKDVRHPAIAVAAVAALASIASTRVPSS